MIPQLPFVALLCLQVVAGEILTIRLDNGMVLQENMDDEGSTWFGRVPINRATFHYTVDDCERLAQDVYAGLRRALDSNINDKNSPNAIRMFGKFGKPKEQLWLTFETDSEHGLATIADTGVRRSEGYPVGSVVGSAKAVRQGNIIPDEAKPRDACKVDDVLTGFADGKNSRACQAVATSLGVQFKDGLPARPPHRNPIGNDVISDNDLANCFQEKRSDSGSARKECALVKPSSAAPSKPATASKASSIPANPALSTSKVALQPSSASLQPSVSIPSRPKAASSVPPKAASSKAALPSSSAVKIVPSKQAPTKAVSTNAALPALSSKVAPPSKAVSKRVPASQAAPAKPVSPAAPAKPVTPAAPPVKSVPTSFKTSVKPSSAVKVSPTKIPAPKPAPAPTAPKSKPAPAKPPKKGGK
ncbi:hypothetical protein VHEMI01603 [[Torrubiella] hemipterigena]|uniref:Uncharacterized protein n=1 Tax=[Torrubiella] hemipterigena TaxID=1531966 RepID=A0A0A1STI3_9HYPO|nr:hypothetical protein VHEMI01603 [[Torrubiella] hemipterigena]